MKLEALQTNAAVRGILSDGLVKEEEESEKRLSPSLALLSIPRDIRIGCATRSAPPSTSGTCCVSIPIAARRPKARSSATRMKRTPTWSGCPRSRADSRPGDPDDRPNPDPSDDTSDESSHSDAVVCVTALKSTGHRASLGRKAPVGPASHALPVAIPRSRIETSSSEFAKGSTCFVRPSPRAP